MRYEDIPSFAERCEFHPDHKNGMISESMLKQRLHEEIDELREYIEQQLLGGCAECGNGGGYALYCLVCAEKFIGNKEWIGLTTDQMRAIAEWQISAHRPLIDVINAVQDKLKELNT